MKDYEKEKVENVCFLDGASNGMTSAGLNVMLMADHYESE